MPNLPFLKAKQVAAVIVAHRKPDGSIEVDHEEGEPAPGLMSAAEDLISAVHMKDAKAVAEALQSAMAGINPEEESEE